MNKRKIVIKKTTKRKNIRKRINRVTKSKVKSTREHGSTVVPTTAAGTGERSTAWAETAATELSGLKRMSL